MKLLVVFILLLPHFLYPDDLNSIDEEHKNYFNLTFNSSQDYGTLVSAGYKYFETIDRINVGVGLSVIRGVSSNLLIEDGANTEDIRGFSISTIFNADLGKTEFEGKIYRLRFTTSMGVNYLYTEKMDFKYGTNSNFGLIFVFDNVGFPFTYSRIINPIITTNMLNLGINIYF